MVQPGRHAQIRLISMSMTWGWPSFFVPQHKGGLFFFSVTALKLQKQIKQMAGKLSKLKAAAEQQVFFFLFFFKKKVDWSANRFYLRGNISQS